MMTMSNALSAGQANTYYQQDYANRKENYYTERGEVNGKWIGSLAEEWGLEGKGEYCRETAIFGNLKLKIDKFISNPKN